MDSYDEVKKIDFIFFKFPDSKRTGYRKQLQPEIGLKG